VCGGVDYNLGVVCVSRNDRQSFSGIGGSEDREGVMDIDKKIRVLKMIVEDMKNDAKNFDGRPFNGRTVSEYFGNQGAAIAALADILSATLSARKIGNNV